MYVAVRPIKLLVPGAPTKLAYFNTTRLRGWREPRSSCRGSQTNSGHASQRQPPGPGPGNSPRRPPPAQPSGGRPRGPGPRAGARARRDRAEVEGFLGDPAGTSQGTARRRPTPPEPDDRGSRGLRFLVATSTECAAALPDHGDRQEIPQRRRPERLARFLKPPRSRRASGSAPAVASGRPRPRRSPSV